MSGEFTASEYQLYGRQMILPELGMAGQQKLKNSTAVVVGAGGLGAPALLYLAGAGVGRVVIVDDDVVELSNLHRQVIHTAASVGNSKAESAAAALRSLNPLIEVRALRERLSEQNIDAVLAEADVVLDGSDNFPTRYLVSAGAARAGIAHVWAAILGFDAQLSVFHAGHGPVYEDLYPQAPSEGAVPNCATAGVIGAMAGVVGSAMAMEAIKVLTGVGRPLCGEVGYYSALEGRWDYIPLQACRKNTTPSKGHKIINVIKRNISSPPVDADTSSSRTTCSVADYLKLKAAEDVVLIDVREVGESAALAIPGAHHISVNTFESYEKFEDLPGYLRAEKNVNGKAIVVYCSGGPRSGFIAERLRGFGFQRVFDLSGGVGAWIDHGGATQNPR
ncbi:ThiF family adenylyltransferase [Rothia sp. LK2588]|uniref:ThiF family adenylyltransferase n=1 Tax=Rothia sp. LK2588 TaxID=3114369 RepID=UPI0034CD637A